MLDTHILEKDSCYDPEADDINTILSHVVYIINKKYTFEAVGHPKYKHTQIHVIYNTLNINTHKYM
jgi:hypothetical protein